MFFSYLVLYNLDNNSHVGWRKDGKASFLSNKEEVRSTERDSVFEKFHFPCYDEKAYFCE